MSPHHQTAAAPSADSVPRVRADASLLSTLRNLWPYIWPKDRPDLKGRIYVALVMMVVGKLITKKSNSFRVPLMGVRKKFQDGVLGSALAIGVSKTVGEFHRSRGAKWAEMSWILEDNTGMRHIMETIGATAYKTYRVYEKQL